MNQLTGKTIGSQHTLNTTPTLTNPNRPFYNPSTHRKSKNLSENDGQDMRIILQPSLFFSVIKIMTFRLTNSEVKHKNGADLKSYVPERDPSLINLAR